MLFHRLQQLQESKIAMNLGQLDMQLMVEQFYLSATYAFELTDGAGNIYASFTGGDIEFAK